MHSLAGRAENCGNGRETGTARDGTGEYKETLNNHILNKMFPYHFRVKVWVPEGWFQRLPLALSLPSLNPSSYRAGGTICLTEGWSHVTFIFNIFQNLWVQVWTWRSILIWLLLTLGVLELDPTDLSESIVNHAGILQVSQETVGSLN